MPIQPPDFGPYQWVWDLVIKLNDIASFGLAGNAWPEGDEDRLAELGDRWGEVADALGEFLGEANTSASEVFNAYGGLTGVAALESWMDLSEHVPDLLTGAYSIRGQVLQGTVEIEYAKYSIICEVTITVIGVYIAMLSSYYTLGGSNASIPGIIQAGRVGVTAFFRELVTNLGRMGLGQAARTAWRTGGRAATERLLVNVAGEAGEAGFQRFTLAGLREMTKEGIEEMAEELAIDGSAQGAQMLFGHRTEWDVDRTLIAGTAGFMGGFGGKLVFGDRFFGGFFDNRLAKADWVSDNPFLALPVRATLAGAQNVLVSGLGGYGATQLVLWDQRDRLPGLGDSLWAALPGAFATGASRAGLNFGATSLGQYLSPFEIDPGTGQRYVRPGSFMVDGDPTRYRPLAPGPDGDGPSNGSGAASGGGEGPSNGGDGGAGQTSPDGGDGRPVEAAGGGDGGSGGTPAVPSGADEFGRRSFADLVPVSTEDAAIRADEIAADLFDGLAGREYAGLTVEPNPGAQAGPVTLQPDSVVARLQIRGESGVVGHATIEIARNRDGVLYAEHIRTQLDESVQGRGFLRTWQADLETWGRTSLSHFVVDASGEAAGDVGGYAWAAIGFDFRPDTEHRVRDIVDAFRHEIAETRSEADRLRALPQPDRAASARLADLDRQTAEAQSIVDRAQQHRRIGQDGFPTAYEFSQAGRGEQQGREGTWIGKRVMANARFWGIKPIAEPPVAELPATGGGVDSGGPSVADRLTAVSADLDSAVGTVDLALDRVTSRYYAAPPAPQPGDRAVELRGLAGDLMRSTIAEARAVLRLVTTISEDAAPPGWPLVVRALMAMATDPAHVDSPRQMTANLLWNQTIPGSIGPAVAIGEATAARAEVQARFEEAMPADPTGFSADLAAVTASVRAELLLQMADAMAIRMGVDAMRADPRTTDRYLALLATAAAQRALLPTQLHESAYGRGSPLVVDAAPAGSDDRDAPGEPVAPPTDGWATLLRLVDANPIAEHDSGAVEGLRSQGPVDLAALMVARAEAVGAGALGDQALSWYANTVATDVEVLASRISDGLGGVLDVRESRLAELVRAAIADGATHELSRFFANARSGRANPHPLVIEAWRQLEALTMAAAVPAMDERLAAYVRDDVLPALEALSVGASPDRAPLTRLLGLTEVPGLSAVAADAALGHLGGHHRSYGGLRVLGTRDAVAIGPGQITASLLVVDATNHAVGSATVHLGLSPDGTPTVRYSGVELDPASDIVGFLGAWTADLEGWFRDSGVPVVEADAVGYPFAALGFDTRWSDPQARSDLRAIVARFRAGGGPAVEAFRVEVGRALVGTGPWPTMQALSQVGREPDASTWPGRRAIEGMPWPGEKRLSPPTDGPLAAGDAPSAGSSPPGAVAAIEHREADDPTVSPAVAPDDGDDEPRASGDRVLAGVGAEFSAVLSILGGGGPPSEGGGGSSGDLASEDDRDAASSGDGGGRVPVAPPAAAGPPDPFADLVAALVRGVEEGAVAHALGAHVTGVEVVSADPLLVRFQASGGDDTVRIRFDPGASEPTVVDGKLALPVSGRPAVHLAEGIAIVMAGPALTTPAPRPLAGPGALTVRGEVLVGSRLDAPGAELASGGAPDADAVARIVATAERLGVVGVGDAAAVTERLAVAAATAVGASHVERSVADVMAVLAESGVDLPAETAGRYADWMAYAIAESHVRRAAPGTVSDEQLAELVQRRESAAADLRPRLAALDATGAMLERLSALVEAELSAVPGEERRHLAVAVAALADRARTERWRAVERRLTAGRDEVGRALDHHRADAAARRDGEALGAVLAERLGGEPAELADLARSLAALSAGAELDPIRTAVRALTQRRRPTHERALRELLATLRPDELLGLWSEPLPDGVRDELPELLVEAVIAQASDAAIPVSDRPVGPPPTTMDAVPDWLRQRLAMGVDADTVRAEGVAVFGRLRDGAPGALAALDALSQDPARHDAATRVAQSVLADYPSAALRDPSVDDEYAALRPRRYDAFALAAIRGDAAAAGHLDGVLVEASARLDDLAAAHTAAAEAARESDDRAETAEQDRGDRWQPHRLAERERQRERDLTSAARHDRAADAYRVAAGRARTAAEAFATDAAHAAEPNDAFLAAVDRTQPLREALHAGVAFGRLPHLNALADVVNAHLSAYGSDARPRPDELERLLRAQWRWVAGAEGAILVLGEAGVVEVGIRFRHGDPVEVAGEPTTFPELILGQLPQSFPYGNRIVEAGRTQGRTLLGTIPVDRVIDGLTELTPEGTRLRTVLDPIRDLADIAKPQVGVEVVRQRTERGAGAAFGLPGAVATYRGEGVLFDVDGVWEVRVRTDATIREHGGRNADGWTSTVEVAGDALGDGGRLRLVLPAPYTEPGPGETVTVRPGEPIEAAFPPMVVTNLGGLEELADRILDVLGPEHSMVGDVPRSQLRNLLFSELTAELRETINAPAGLQRVLSNDGRRVAILRIRTRVHPDPTPIGPASDRFHQERLRIAFSGVSGGTEQSRTSRRAYGLRPTAGVADAPIVDELGIRGDEGRTRRHTTGLRTDAMAIRPAVQRWAGHTQSYRVRLTYEVAIDVLGDASRSQSVSVDGHGLLLLPEPDAYRYGFPVDAAAVRPSDAGVPPSHGGVPHGDGVRLRDDPDPAPPPGRQPRLPDWMAGRPDGIPGAGPALAQDMTGIDGIRSQVVERLGRDDLLPEPLVRALLGDHGGIAASGDEVLELQELSQLSAASLEARYDQLAQDGIVIELLRHREHLAPERVTLLVRLEQHMEAVSYVGFSHAEQVVSLDIANALAAETAGESANRSRAYGGSGAGADASAIRDAGFTRRTGSARSADETTANMVNAVTLVEGQGPTAVFTVPHTLIVERLNDDGTRPELARHDGSARLLVPVDLLPEAEGAAMARHAGPVPDAVLRAATMLHADARGVWGAVRDVLPDGARLDAAGHLHARAFADTRSLVANDELLRSSYGTDFVLDGREAPLRSSLSISGAARDARFVGVARLILGDINLTASQHTVGFGHEVQRGWGVEGTYGPDVDGSRDTSASSKRTSTRSHGRERLVIDTGLAYVFEADVDLRVSGTEHAHTGDRTRHSDLTRRWVYALPERAALELYARGELALPESHVDDALERYGNGALALDDHVATAVRERRETDRPADAVPPEPRPVALPESLEQAAGHSGLEVRDEEQALLDAVIDRIETVAPGALRGAPGLRTYLYANLVGERWLGHIDAMLEPPGFQLSVPVPFDDGKVSRLFDERVTVTITASFEGDAFDAGHIEDVGIIDQAYAWQEIQHSESAGRSYGLALGGDVPGSPVDTGVGPGVGRTLTGSAAEQETRLWRVSAFDGVDRIERTLRITIEATRSHPQSVRQLPLRVTDLLRRRPDHDVLDVVATLHQLVPAGVVDLSTSDTLLALSMDVTAWADRRPVELPGVYNVDSVRAGGLVDAVLDGLAGRSLLGADGVAARRHEIKAQLSAMHLNAWLPMAVHGGGYPAVTVTVPGRPDRVVKVRVRVDPSNARLVVQRGRLEFGVADRHQRAISEHDLRRGPLPATWVVGDEAKVGGGAAVSEQASFTAGNRDESSLYVSGDASVIGVRLDFHLTFERRTVVPGGGYAADPRPVAKPYAAVGGAYLTVFDHDLAAMLTAPEPAPDWRPSEGPTRPRRGVLAYHLDELLGEAARRPGFRPGLAHVGVADVLRDRLGPEPRPGLRLAADGTLPVDHAVALAEELGTEIVFETGEARYRATPGAGLAAGDVDLRRFAAVGLTLDVARQLQEELTAPPSADAQANPLTVDETAAALRQLQRAGVARETAYDLLDRLADPHLAAVGAAVPPPPSRSTVLAVLSEVAGSTRAQAAAVRLLRALTNN